MIPSWQISSDRGTRENNWNYGGRVFKNFIRCYSSKQLLIIFFRSSRKTLWYCWRRQDEGSIPCKVSWLCKIRSQMSIYRCEQNWLCKCKLSLLSVGLSFWSCLNDLPFSVHEIQKSTMSHVHGRTTKGDESFIIVVVISNRLIATSLVTIFTFTWRRWSLILLTISKF